MLVLTKTPDLTHFYYIMKHILWYNSFSRLLFSHSKGTILKSSLVRFFWYPQSVRKVAGKKSYSTLKNQILHGPKVNILRLDMTFDASPKCAWVRIPLGAESFFSFFSISKTLKCITWYIFERYIEETNLFIIKRKKKMKKL